MRLIIRKKNTKTVRTIIKSRILFKSVLVIISLINDETRLHDIAVKSGMTYSAVLKDINKLEEWGLISSKYLGKERIIVPTDDLNEMRKLLIALVRKIEGVEKFED